MGTALVTTLKEAITDTSLLKLGELKVYAKKKSENSPTRFKFEHQGVGKSMRIVGEGYFTDSTGTSNLGKTSTTSSTDQYLANMDTELVVEDKYNIKTAYTYQSSGIIEIDDESFTGMNVLGYNSLTFENTECLKYLPALKNLDIRSAKTKGDIANIKSNHIEHIWIDSPNIYGDVANLKNCSSLVYFLASGETKDVYGDICSAIGLNENIANMTNLGVYENPLITGNISNLAGATSMQNLQLRNVGVSGNLSSLNGLTSLTTLDLSGTNVVGDTSDLANLTNLTTFTYTNTAITGTWPLT